MSCEHFESLIALDVGGDLPAGDAGSLARHQETCAACRRFATEMRESQQAIHLLADTPIDKAALRVVRARVRHEVDRRSAAILPRLPARAVALAATLAVSIGALLLFRSGQTDRSEPDVLGDFQRTAETLGRASLPSATRPPTDIPDESLEVSATGSEADSLLPQSVADRVPKLSESMAASAKPAPQVTVNPQLSEISADATGSTAPPASEPMIIKLVSEDADLVIYWLVQADDDEIEKETKDEVSAV